MKIIDERMNERDEIKGTSLVLLFLFFEVLLVRVWFFSGWVGVCVDTASFRSRYCLLCSGVVFIFAFLGFPAIRGPSDVAFSGEG